MLRQIRRLMVEQWSRRGELANWAAIARIRTSFLAKATTALSLTTFVLGNFDTIFRDLASNRGACV